MFCISYSNTSASLFTHLQQDPVADLITTLSVTRAQSFSRVWLFVTTWTAAYLPGSSVHGIFQARTLEWVVISYSRVYSRPRDWTHVSCIGRQIVYHQATWEILIATQWRAYHIDRQQYQCRMKNLMSSGSKITGTINISVACTYTHFFLS